MEITEDKYLRLLADFDNYKKNTEKRINEIEKNAEKNVFVDLIEIVDEVERAIDNGSKAFSTKNTHALLLNLLKKYNVRQYGSPGEQFNEDYHNAIFTKSTDCKYPHGSIEEVVKKGYIMNNSIIRFAQVIVSM